MRRILLFAIILVASLGVKAQNVPEPMTPHRLVNDFAGILTGEGAQVLEDSLFTFYRATSTQIAVVTVNDLEGYAPADYALAIMRKWGVGMKEKNNGIVVLLKPRNEHGRGEVYISVGGGLEGVLNDAKAGRIIDNYMLEDLKTGDYLQATIKGTAVIRSIVRGEFTADEALEGNNEDDIISVVIFFIIFFIVLICIVKFRKKYGYRGGYFPPTFFGGGGRSGGFSGGSGGFGGFGGGSGFGGGAGRSF